MTSLNERQKGAALMCSSAFFFSAMQIAINLTGGTIPLMEQIFARSFISLIISFVLIRKSGTEPVIRIMAECENEKLCDEFCQSIADLIVERGYSIG